MQNLCLRISLFDLVIRKGLFTISVLKVSFKEGRYMFRLFGVKIDGYYMQLQILGIPIVIPLKVR